MQHTTTAIRENGVVTGYASLFGVRDLNGDMVLRGAFQKSLRIRPASDIKFLFQHDPKDPIGVWLHAEEDALGLKVTGRLLSEVNRAREAYALIKAGALDGLSIGFKAEKAKRQSGKALRELVSIDLWEISLVTFPMLPGARLAALGAFDLSQMRLANALRQATETLQQQRQS